jgi:FkbM family methyltransferase
MLTQQSIQRNQIFRSVRWRGNDLGLQLWDGDIFAIHIQQSEHEVNGAKEYRLWEEQQMDEFAEFIEKRVGRAPKVLLDIGANIGLTALQFALRWPKCKVHAIEALPENYALLVENARNVKNIICHHALLMHEASEFRYWEFPDNSGCARVLPEEIADADLVFAPRMFKAVTLDELCQREKITPEAIKIDVEDQEWRVFQGGVKTIGAGSLVIMAEHGYPHNLEQGLSVLAPLGYEVVAEVKDSNPNYIYAKP